MNHTHVLIIATAYVGVPAHGHVCGAQIVFNCPAQESLAKSIALSVGPVP